MADPANTLVKAFVAKWLASAASLSGIAGPYHSEKPTHAAATFPYVIFKADAVRTRTTSASDYWRVTLALNVWDTTPENCATQVDKVLAVFDSDSLKDSFTMAEGHLLNQRLDQSECERIDKTVWRTRLLYRFNIRRPRVT